MIYSKVSIDNKKEAGFKIYEKSKKIPQALESECLTNKTHLVQPTERKMQMVRWNHFFWSNNIN
jgi:hypothetical protein